MVFSCPAVGGMVQIESIAILLVSGYTGTNCGSPAWSSQFRVSSRYHILGLGLHTVPRQALDCFKVPAQVPV